MSQWHIFARARCVAKYLDNMSGGIGVVGDGAVVFEAIAPIAQVAEWTTDPLQNNRNPLPCELSFFLFCNSQFHH